MLASYISLVMINCELPSSLSFAHSFINFKLCNLTLPTLTKKKPPQKQRGRPREADRQKVRENDYNLIKINLKTKYDASSNSFPLLTCGIKLTHNDENMTLKDYIQEELTTPGVRPRNRVDNRS